MPATTATQCRRTSADAPIEAAELIGFVCCEEENSRKNATWAGSLCPQHSPSELGEGRSEKCATLLDGQLVLFR